jgi:ubiquinone/menaquinone biosynthesis C-methylase UbiE
VPDARRPEELRSIHRVPVRVLVSDTQRSAPLGDTRDISLDGLFLATEAPWREGDVLPIGLSLTGAAGGELLAEVEVVRVAQDGVGLRFRAMSAEHRRRLRRHVSSLTSAAGTRATAERLLHGHAGTTAPIEAPDRIRSLLDRTRTAGVALRIIPADRNVLEEARLTARDDVSLHLEAGTAIGLEAGERILVLYTFEFVSFSFQSRVVRVQGRALTLEIPSLVAYSERRADTRLSLEEETWLEVELPWHEAPACWPVLERGSGGLSFRADPGSWAVFPGAPLPGAALRTARGREPLGAAVVKNVRRVDVPGEAPWLRVGVECGVRRAALAPEVARVAGPSGWGARVLGVLRRGWTGLTLLWHRRGLASPGSESSGPTPVRLRSRRGLELVGLLDTTFERGEVVRAPLVLVIPGFGGRKEQTSYLANILTGTFRRQHADVAVLRLDGSNNLGESQKDEGCGEEGRHTLHFTLGGVEADLLGALDWARETRLLDVERVIVVSVSFASCAVARVLARTEVPEVTHWVSYMGAADPRDAVLHVSGHYDVFAAAAEGERLGPVTLIGCVVDAQHFFDDLRQLGIGTLREMRADMAAIRADITWLAGVHDGWMDLARVRDVMAVAGRGARKLVEVDTGHVPRSGEEAIRQFGLVADAIWRHVHGSPSLPWTPSLGRLEALRQVEWARVRRASPGDRAAFWRGYLMGRGEVGFDVLAWSPAYRQLVDAQVGALAPAGEAVLELGAGTGNVTLAIARTHPSRLVCVDLVEDALQAACRKVAEAGLPAPEARVWDLECGPVVALRRWQGGELRRVQDLARRVPGIPSDLARRLDERGSPRLDAVLRGLDLDAGAVAATEGLDAEAGRLLADLQVLARLGRGRITLAEATSALRRLPASCLAGPGPLPFPDGAFTRVVASLLLSYLGHPADVLAEAFRLLRPGGRLVVSSMRRDADTSKLFQSLLEFLVDAPAEALGGESRRQVLVAAAREFLGHASDLFRMEEEGLFRFYGREELADMLRAAGFDDVVLLDAFGEPPQAVVAACRRP